MKNMLLFLLLLLPFYCCSQSWTLATINDPDGYSFIRSGKGKDFPVIDTVKKDWFFYCTGDTAAQWVSVVNPTGKEGYMHKTRIAIFSRLGLLEQQHLILMSFDAIIESEKTFAETHPITAAERDAASLKRTGIFEGRYIPAADAMNEIFKVAPDSVLFCAFVHTLPWVSGSADESIPSVCESCWLAHPAFVDNLICHWENKAERNAFIGNVEAGIGLIGQALFSEKQLSMELKKLKTPCTN